jgi:dTDP-4-dehydrorhamnose 3,5-epimerase
VTSERLAIPGLILLRATPYEDERGIFSRTFCRHELQDLGVDFSICQCNTSTSYKAGTIRGIHYQLPPRSEQKLIRCVHGSLFDVVVDLRPESPTFLQVSSIVLDGSDTCSLLIPARCGHALQTLEDHTIMNYCTSEPYDHSRERGLRWEDPLLAIPWPMPVSTLSAKDQALPWLEDHLAEISSSMDVKHMSISSK